MALKGDRYELRTDISFFMLVPNPTGTLAAERGRIVVHGTSGSGAAMDQAKANVVIPTGGTSGTYPAGLLLNDVVNLDLTRQHINWHRDEVQNGNKVTLAREGFWVTNMIHGSPTAGQNAYFDVSGYLTPTNPAGANTGFPGSVGRFLSAPDADGYAKVDIMIVGN